MSNKVYIVKEILESEPWERGPETIDELLNLFDLRAITEQSLGIQIKNPQYLQETNRQNLLHRLIVKNLRFASFQNAETLIRLKDSTNFHCFLVIDGCVNVMEDKQILHTFKRGEVFSDKLIMRAAKRNVVFAFTPKTYVAFTKYEEIESVLTKEQPDDDTAPSYFQNSDRFLNSLPFFTRLTNSAFKRFTLSFSSRDYIAGEKVFSQDDDIADTGIFIIKSGQFVVEKEVEIIEQQNQSEDDSFESINLSGKTNNDLLAHGLKPERQSKKSMMIRVMAINDIFGEEEIIRTFSTLTNVGTSSFTASSLNQLSRQKRAYSVKCREAGVLIRVLLADFIKRILPSFSSNMLKQFLSRIDQKDSMNANRTKNIQETVSRFRRFILPDSVIQPSPQSKSQIETSSASPTKNTQFTQFFDNSITATTTTRSQSTSHIFSNSLARETDHLTISGSTQTSQILSPPHSTKHKQTSITPQIFIKSGTYLFSDINSNGNLKPLTSNRRLFSSQLSSKPPSESKIPSITCIEMPQSPHLSISQQIKSQSQQKNNTNISEAISPSIVFNTHESDRPIISERNRVQFATSSGSLATINSVDNWKQNHETIFDPTFRSHSNLMHLQQLEIQKKQEEIQISKAAAAAAAASPQQKQNVKKSPNKAKQVPQFIEFVSPQEAKKKNQKIIGEEEGMSLTYSGLNTKVVHIVQKRSMKIKLLSPIFDRGYAQAFQKEIIKLNKRNTRTNYLEDLREEKPEKSIEQLQQNILEGLAQRTRKQSATFSNEANPQTNQLYNTFIRNNSASKYNPFQSTQNSNLNSPILNHQHIAHARKNSAPIEINAQAFHSNNPFSASVNNEELTSSRRGFMGSKTASITRLQSPLSSPFQDLKQQPKLPKTMRHSFVLLNKGVSNFNEQ